MLQVRDNTVDAVPLAVARVAAALTEPLAKGDVVYVATDDQRATDIAAIARALAPDAVVVHLPSSDALPGDDSPASPANVGLRVAALRRLRGATASETAAILLVTTAEATAVRYPEPAMFDAAPPRLVVGDPIDSDVFATTAAAIGYCVDDRIDEPGEIAVRGTVIDIFPADRDAPVRIEFADGRITALREYDPVTQLGLADIAFVEIGRATEPSMDKPSMDKPSIDKPSMDKGVAILAHLPNAAIGFDPGADRRRERFLALAADGLPRRKASADLVAAKAWETSVAKRAVLTMALDDDAVPRFVEQRDPARGFADLARDVLADSRLVLVGSPRDLRFLQPRLERSAKITFTTIACGSAVAAAVALSGRQVAIAAPTTVLVRQHLETFTRRFEGSGVAVAGLSRLSTAAEKSRVKAGLADGSIGVVIGTGAIAGKGVAYKDLALVVIDEEQRFGAADKAGLHALGAGHVLTLSATPIPRTLQSAMIGLQGLSVIATPPARRQPIRTAVASFDEASLRAALRRERARGGQSFVVVPRIADMAPLAATLARLVPELGLVQAHGKMPATEIDEAMVGFAAGDGDVLLATNIIEAGLDVPRANTMIVHHADRFGLSQLHQLRGRVGRGGRRGQVMLLTDGDATIAEATLKRLRTLQAFDRLGAGFAISARDLDLRGAGDLVGEAQAGHMKLIGIDLYQHLFGRALRLARGEHVDDWVPELHLEVGGCLPATWIPEEEIRLSLYGRLARLDDVAALDRFEAELEDRFGTIPGPARHLLLTTRIRLRAHAAGIRRIDAGPAAIAFTPHERHRPAPLADLVERNGRWIARLAIDEPVERAARIEEMLDALAG